MSTDESKREETTQHNDGEDAVKRTVSGRHAGTDLVAFFATLSQTAEHLGAHQNVLFDNIITNVGSGYNQHLGGFTAPVSGMYVFMTTVMSQTGHNAHFQLLRNGHVVCNMYVGGKGYTYNHDASAGSFVLQLSKGDVVAIQNLDSGEILFGGHYSYFSGFLLKAIEEDPSIIG
ncbi:complement C1q-like protein 4 [Dreissena polymorpha]|uniref:C1q domain-containing protein n=1 Tax=Dreissena polymorpha TaxID=45954 RepID=A0A9D4QZA7_DREPO|nr:complement C1q-like protein 4 [Dreissena polymorpha]KAH3849104.1 hypothetical protein DPMN_091497 [Dreissena polymorpha]